MQLFEFLMLVLEQTNVPGLMLAAARVLPTMIILAILVRLNGPNHLECRHEKPLHALDNRLLRDLRTACHDFGREVDAWERAAHQQGGRADKSILDIAARETVVLWRTMVVGNTAIGANAAHDVSLQR